MEKAAHGPVSLFFGAKNEAHNNAVYLSLAGAHSPEKLALR